MYFWAQVIGMGYPAGEHFGQLERLCQAKNLLVENVANFKGGRI